MTDKSLRLSREIAQKHELAMRLQARGDYEAIQRAKADLAAQSPSEVAADELAAAVAGMRSIAAAKAHPLVRTGAIEAIRDDVRLVMAEFDRRGEEATYWQRECKAWLRIAIAADGQRFEELEADLARALPVVEAAERVLEKSSYAGHLPPCVFDCIGCRIHALATAVRAARGEQS